MEESANGARYESQGQARSEAERVAPGKYTNERFRPERPKYLAYYALSGLDLNFDLYQGRRASRLPLAFISRAVGAVLRLLCKAVPRCSSWRHRLRKRRFGHLPFFSEKTISKPGECRADNGS